MKHFKKLLVIFSIAFFCTGILVHSPTRLAAKVAEEGSSQLACFFNPDDAFIKEMVIKRGGYSIFAGLNDKDTLLELFIIPKYNEWIIAFRKPDDIICPIPWGPDPMWLKKERKPGSNVSHQLQPIPIR